MAVLGWVHESACHSAVLTLAYPLLRWALEMVVFMVSVFCRIGGGPHASRDISWLHVLLNDARRSLQPLARLLLAPRSSYKAGRLPDKLERRVQKLAECQWKVCGAQCGCERQQRWFWVWLPTTLASLPLPTVCCARSCCATRCSPLWVYWQCTANLGCGTPSNAGTAGPISK